MPNQLVGEQCRLENPLNRLGRFTKQAKHIYVVPPINSETMLAQIAIQIEE